MERIAKFDALASDPWYGRQFKKLRKADIDFCHGFIVANTQLSKDEFESAVNRIFMDKRFDGETKADKNRRMICQELLACCS